MYIGTLIKQPNEKYCVVNYAGEVSCYNLTEQDIIDLYIEDAKAHIDAARHYGILIAETIGYEGKTNDISDDVLKEMGFSKTYKELVKFVPRKPLATRYVNYDFTTYGKCPNCDETVRNGMGHTDNQCKCGQSLKW
jgi:hypothetical protein